MYSIFLTLTHEYYNIDNILIKPIYS